MTSLCAFRFRLPMTPLVLAGRQYSSREGLLLCDRETHSFWGEASPLPGFSLETLDELVVQLRQGPPYSSPALRFAVDSVETQRVETVPQEDASQGLLQSKPPNTLAPLPINALIATGGQLAIDLARKLGKSSFQSVKLKVGTPAKGTTTEAMDEAAAFVKVVRNCLRPDQSLRLDANRAWPLEAAIAFGQALRRDGVNVEYIEEPVRDPADLEAFYGGTGLPYALDETLRERRDLESFPHAGALIVKPMLHGGLGDLQWLVASELPLVFSGTFETGVGTLAIAKLANQYSPNVPAGLEAHFMLEDDVLQPRLSSTGGYLRLDTRHAITWDHLEEV